MKRITSITIFFLFTIVLFSQKVKIEKAEDLPKHYYKLESTTALDYIKDDALAIRLANEIENNLKADLEKYDIQDKATLRGYEGMFRTIALIKKDYKAALMHLKRKRELSEKEEDKLLSGIEEEAYILAKLDKNISSDEAFKKALRKNLTQSLEAAPYEVIKESVERAVGMLDVLNENIFLGVLEGQMQPVLDKSKDQVPQFASFGLLDMNLTFKIMLPYAKEVYHPVYQKLYDDNHAEVILVDIWNDRDVAFDSNEPLEPVVIGIWDGGVDMNVFPKNNQWINSKEKVDGKDNDINGFIDDVHGIGFDEEGKPEIGVLLNAKKIYPDIEKYRLYSKGLKDMNAAIKSKEADDFKKFIASLKPNEIRPFIEKLSLYGNYAHGSHVGGIAAKGNPKAKIMAARMTYSYKNIAPPPTLEKSKNWAKMYKNTINHFKNNNVRVVNMSWGYSQNWYENRLAENGIGANKEERKVLAKKLFGMERDAIYSAMKNAPEILFITSAGNSNNDVDFANNIPSGFDLPNLMKIGAVDIEGKETGFTTMGRSVDVYGNGYEVESYVPGGTIQKMSGTSMSSPQVANLAGKIWAMYPTLDVQEVKKLIITGATVSPHNPEILLLHPKRSLEMAKEIWKKKQ